MSFQTPIGVPFDLSVSGRTITPVGAIYLDGRLLVPNYGYGATTLVGVTEGAILDLVIVDMGAGTYGYTTNLQGTTGPGPNQWLIGTVKDFPIEGTCQVLLFSTLAFQSDQYVAVEADGVHIKPFGSTGSSPYGQVVIETPTNTGNLSLYADGTTAFVNAAAGHLTLSTHTNGSALSVTASGLGSTLALSATTSASLTATSVLVESLGATLTLEAQGGGASVIVTSINSAVTITAAATSVWSTSSGNLTVQNSGTGSATLTAAAGGTVVSATSTGTVGISTNSGTLSITTTSGAVTITAAATSTWSTSSGNLSILNSGTGNLTVGANSGTAQLSSTTGAVTITTNSASLVTVSNSGAGGITVSALGGTITISNSTRAITVQGVVAITSGSAGTVPATIANVAAQSVDTFVVDGSAVTNGVVIHHDKSGHLAASQAAVPTIAAGTGAGTLPTLAVLAGSTDHSGVLQITTGTAPAGTNAILATISFKTALATAPRAIIVQPANAAAINLARNQDCLSSRSLMTTAQWVLATGSVALAASTAYEFQYWVF